jgi:hypothetical protein
MLMMHLWFGLMAQSSYRISAANVQLIMEKESDGVIPFLNVLVITKKMTLVFKVYRKPTCAGRYLNFNSNHMLRMKRGLIQSLYKRASTICQEP